MTAFSPRGLVGLFLACAALAAIGYATVFAAPFVADDYALLFGLTDGSTGLAALGVRRDGPFLRPLLGLSFALDWRLFGADPVAMHAVNVALHTLAAWLLGIVAAAWAGTTAAGWVAAAAFACFPVHPEAVTWISARGYPLGACCTLLVVWIALRRERPVWLAAGAALALAALFSVEAALPLAAYPLALAWAIGRARPGLRASAAVLLATVLYLALRLAWIGGLGGYRDADGASRHTSLDLGHAARYVLRAFAHLLAPGPWDGADGRAINAAVGGIGAGALALHAAAGPGRDALRRAGALVGCVLAALSVTATWAMLAADLGGSRYLYFASLFWCLALGWSAARAWAAGGARAGVAAVALAAVLAGQIAVLRTVNARWRAAGELARAAIEGAAEHLAGRPARHVLVFGVPASLHGAHVLPWSFDAALLARIGRDLHVDVLRDEEQLAVARRAWGAASPADRAAVEIGAFDAPTRRWTWH